MSARLNWDKAKPKKPSLDKNAEPPADRMAKRARLEMWKWKRALPKRDRKRLEAVF